MRWPPCTTARRTAHTRHPPPDTRHHPPKPVTAESACLNQQGHLNLSPNSKSYPSLPDLIMGVSTPAFIRSVSDHAPRITESRSRGNQVHSPHEEFPHCRIDQPLFETNHILQPFAKRDVTSFAQSAGTGMGTPRSHTVTAAIRVERSAGCLEVGGAVLVGECGRLLLVIYLKMNLVFIYAVF